MPRASWSTSATPSRVESWDSSLTPADVRSAPTTLWGQMVSAFATYRERTAKIRRITSYGSTGVLVALIVVAVVRQPREELPGEPSSIVVETGRAAPLAASALPVLSAEDERRVQGVLGRLLPARPSGRRPPDREVDIAAAERAIDQLGKRVVACSREVRRTGPAARGLVVVDVDLAVVDGHGEVTAVALNEARTTVASSFLRGCVVAVLRHAPFDAPGDSGVVRATFPFAFLGDGEGPRRRP
jgi:hypothetical protein